MSWMSRLCEIYDYAIACGAGGEQPFPLPEIGFKSERVNAVITLTESGEFLDLEQLPNKTEIVVPATPDSIVARGEPVQPHPIFDKIKELGTEKQLAILGDWCENGDAPTDVKIIYSYLRKGVLPYDIKVAADKKGVKLDFEKAFVCLKVTKALWTDESFIESWKKQYQRLLSERKSGLCYATGSDVLITAKHPYASANICFGCRNIPSPPS